MSKTTQKFHERFAWTRSDSDSEAEKSDSDSDTDAETSQGPHGTLGTRGDATMWHSSPAPVGRAAFAFVPGYKGKRVERTFAQLQETLGRGGGMCYQESLESNVHLYFDYEVYYATEAAQKSADARLLRSIVEMIATALKIAPGCISILKACGAKPQPDAEPKYINSYHLIVQGPEFVFPCGAAAGRFIEATLPPEFEPKPDMAVYNEAGKRRLFRAPLQEKGGRDCRAMMPYILGAAPMSRSAAHSFLFGGDRPRIAEYLVTAYDSAIDSIMPFNTAFLPYDTAAAAPMEPFEPHSGEFERALENLSILHPDELTNYDFDHAPSGNRLFSSRIPGAVSECVVCRVKHDRFTPMIIVFEHSAIYTCPRRTQHRGEAITLYADEREPEPGAALRRALAAPAAAAADTPEADTNITVDVKYLADAPCLAEALYAPGGAAAFVGIKSPMGSGKSVAVSRLINADATKRVLVITMRISLSQKYREDYPAFAHYQDAKADITAPRAIVVIDSIHRVALERPFDIVVLDESEALVSHLTCDTFVRQPTLVDTMARLKNIMGRAGRIVAMDANLSQHGMATLKLLRREGAGAAGAAMGTVVITNTHISAPRDILLTHDRNGVIDNITDALIAKKRCYVAINNSAKRIATTAETICQIALRNMPPGAEIKCLIVSSTTLLSDPVQAALRDPRGEWGKYDIIFASPTIQSGISYDLADFDCIFGIFNNVTNSCADMLQQLSRIRHPRDSTVRVSLTRQNSPAAAIVTAQDLLDRIVENSAGAAAEQAMRNGMIGYHYDSRGLKEITETMFYRIYRDNLLRANADKRGFEANFIRIARAAGHRPAECNQAPLDREETKAIIKVLRDVSAIAAADENAALAAADDITPDRAESLEADFRAGRLGHEESLTAKITLWRHRLMVTYDVPFDAVLPPEWFALRKKKSDIYRSLCRYANGFDGGLAALLDAECDKEMFARMREGDEPLVLHALATKKHARHKFLLELLKSYGIQSLCSGETDRDTITTRSGALFADATHTIHVLGKQKRCLKTLERNAKLCATHPDSVCEYILKFINPVLSAEFGVSIKPRERRSTTFVITNSLAAALAAAPPPELRSPECPSAAAAAAAGF